MNLFLLLSHQTIDKIMASIPNSYTSLKGFWAHVLALPIFALGFYLLFRPYHFYSQFYGGFSEYSFHITMIMCIILILTVLSRLSMILFRGKVKISKNQYLYWELAEIVADAAFCALYIWLIMGRSAAYFEFFGYSLIYLFPVLAIPDIIIALFLEQKENGSSVTEVESMGNYGKIRFFDEKNNLKLMVTADSLLYIQADENYLKICYLDSDKISDYSLRSSMKRVESLCEKNGLIRCHRSFYVNKLHVKVLQKDKNDTFALLDVPSAIRIPVSRNYYDQLSALL
jgi:Response regulator of the LytR/AlgR family